MFSDDSVDFRVRPGSSVCDQRSAEPSSATARVRRADVDRVAAPIARRATRGVCLAAGVEFMRLRCRWPFPDVCAFIMFAAHHDAPVAELVDALDSGSSGRKLVEVRVLSGALKVEVERGEGPAAIQRRGLLALACLRLGIRCAVTAA